MALYSYRKEEQSGRKKLLNYISYFALGTGLVLLFWAFYPVIAFEFYSRVFLKNEVVAPIANAENAAPSIAVGNLSSNLRDFTQASLWFPGVVGKVEATGFSIKEYSLSIPKLNIEKSRVIMGSEDLTKGLIHYLPKSLPGEFGNIAIFGHSTLPQLYNVKDYKTIFTYLPSLNKGDKVILEVGGVKYEYEVYEMFVVKPEQVSILEQKNDAAYLTLVTCVPPGTYWNRLIVRAKLIQNYN